MLGMACRECLINRTSHYPFTKSGPAQMPLPGSPPLICFSDKVIPPASRPHWHFASAPALS